jgi:mycothiol synthase
VTDTGRFHLEVLPSLEADELAAVSLLVERATETDGVRPLSEHVTLHLRHGGDQASRHILAYAEGSRDRPHLAGYAHLDATDFVSGPSSELVVDPAWRRHGVGKALVEALRQESTDGRLRLWAHGDHAAAARLAASFGFTQTRELWQMRRSLYAPLPRPEVPDGVTIRKFRPGVDESAWLALNAKAFAHHPEQGQMTLADLEQRTAEPWFDPGGFFLAERQDDDDPPPLVGFHWTKVHGSHPDGFGSDGISNHEHGHAAIGEVYVVGVDPHEQGHGLGRALTLWGLHHLRGLGLGVVMLYVEADNAPAIGVYQRLGFTHWDSDVMFAAPPRSG